LLVTTLSIYSLYTIHNNNNNNNNNIHPNNNTMNNPSSPSSTLLSDSSRGIVLHAPALILIDFQNDFCSPGGYVDHCLQATATTTTTESSSSSSSSLSWVQDIIPAAQRLLQAARSVNENLTMNNNNNNNNNNNSSNRKRNKGCLVIHTREGYDPDLSDCSMTKLKRSQRGGCEIGSPGPLGRLLIRGEQGHDIIPELYPRNVVDFVVGNVKEKLRADPGGAGAGAGVLDYTQEFVMDKTGYCAFRHTPLQQLLETYKVQEILLAGVTADVCVHSTLRTAVELGYQCYYVQDAISTPMGATIRQACVDMVSVEGGIWGQVTSVTEVEHALLVQHE
jgi:biuret amidohydrolase